MKGIYVGLGANLGDREESIRRAVALIGDRGIGRVRRCSALLETEPWGSPDQPSFLNMAVELESALDAGELLRGLKGIEAELGRCGGVRWGPREIDLDILLFGSDTLSTPDLIVPHPRLHERRFVLESLAELDPSLEHPVLGRSMAELLADSKDRCAVRNLGRPGWCGGPGPGEIPA